MPVEKDQEGILTEQALVNLFDKRNTIRGVRKKAKEFRNKWRECFENQSEYRRMVLIYHNQLENMRESNLEYLAQAMGITMDEIDESQVKYLSDKSMTFITGWKEFTNLEVPPWLTVKEAMRIFEELKDML